MTRTALLIAYTCEPDKSGEAAIGWGYVLEAARRFDEVHLVTRENNLGSLHSAVPSNVHMHGVEASRLWLRLKHGQRFVHAYYLAWQRAARRVVGELTREEDVDLVHHVTFCSFALPPISVLDAEASRVVIGPAGGTASIPWRLAHKVLPPKALFREVVRELNIRRVLRSRALRSCLQKADEVYVSSSHERINVGKARISNQAGIELSEVSTLRRRQGASSEHGRVVMVGRLEHFKGYRVAIDALRQDARLSLKICGSGPDESALLAYALRRGVRGRVEFLGHQSREDLFEQLGKADVFLSTSLRETGPLSAVEAHAAGLPVVYLDVGAISQLVPHDAKIRVRRDLPYEETVDEVVEALVKAQQRAVKPSLTHLESLSWTARADVLYGPICRRL